MFLLRFGKRLDLINIPLTGIPIELKLNDKQIYDAQLWNFLSSLGHKGIILMHIPGTQNVDIHASLLEKANEKDDLRFNTNLKRALEALNKLKAPNNAM